MVSRPYSSIAPALDVVKLTPIPIDRSPVQTQQCLQCPAQASVENEAHTHSAHTVSTLAFPRHLVDSAANLG